MFVWEWEQNKKYTFGSGKKMLSRFRREVCGPWDNELQDRLGNFGMPQIMDMDTRFDIWNTALNLTRNKKDKSIQRLLLSNDTITDDELVIAWKLFNQKRGKI